MYVVNCTVKEDISGWVAVAVWEQIVICVIGSICNTLCIWCLVGCQKTGKAVKLQLIFIFSLEIAICLVTLPFVTYLYYVNFFCLEHVVPRRVEFIFSMMNSIFLQWERLNFMAMAIYRVLAVLCPRQYQKLVTVKVAIYLQFGIILFMVPPWFILGILKGFKMTDKSGNVLRLDFVQEGSSSNFVMALYGTYYCLPFIITFIAYVIMIISIIRQNQYVRRRTRRRNNGMDHVASTIRVVILANILLDGPHVVFHLLDYELATIITHMAFFLHLVLDPVIFIVMNESYRTEVHRKIFCNCSPKTIESYVRPSCPSRPSGEDAKESTWRNLELLAAADKRHAVYVE